MSAEQLWETALCASKLEPRHVAFNWPIPDELADSRYRGMGRGVAWFDEQGRLDDICYRDVKRLGAMELDGRRLAVTVIMSQFTVCVHMLNSAARAPHGAVVADEVGPRGFIPHLEFGVEHAEIAMDDATRLRYEWELALARSARTDELNSIHFDVHDVARARGGFNATGGAMLLLTFKDGYLGHIADYATAPGGPAATTADGRLLVVASYDADSESPYCPPFGWPDDRGDAVGCPDHAATVIGDMLAMELNGAVVGKPALRLVKS